jgi:hypothetical protein
MPILSAQIARTQFLESFKSLRMYSGIEFEQALSSRIREPYGRHRRGEQGRLASGAWMMTARGCHRVMAFP